MTIKDLAIMLEKDREKYNRSKSTNIFTRSVILVDEKDENKIELFSSLGKCVEFFLSKGLPINQFTLVKRINTGKVYHGYICKYAK